MKREISISSLGNFESIYIYILISGIELDVVLTFDLLGSSERGLF